MNNSINVLLKKYQTSNLVIDFVGKKYNQKLALIGQDPGITTKNNNFNKVLMLDNSHSRLYHYISKDILNPLSLTVDDIVAINLIPIQLSNSIRKIAQKQQIDFCSLVYQLAEYYYPVFLQKIVQYQPQYLISLGKPVYEFLKQKASLPLGEIKEVFASQFPISINRKKYMLIPCVHYNSRYREPYLSQRLRLSKIAMNKLY